MAIIGFVLLMIGGSGVTDARGALQPVCIVLLAIGMLLLWIGQKGRENGRG